MLKIRLRRMGSRHRPFYRVVVSDSRRTPLSAALDELGYYDPRHSPSVFKVDMEKVDHWISKGAQPSETLSKLVRKARKGGFVDDAAADDAAAEAPAEEKAEKAEATEEKKDADKKDAEPKAEAKAEEASAAEEAPAAEEKADEADGEQAEDKGEA